MVKTKRPLALALGCTFLGLAVILGAFAAHGLEPRLTDYAKNIWQKALFYQVFHGLGLLSVGIFSRLDLISHRVTAIATVLMTLGILLFSGSLYLLALTDQRWLGAITPFGGTMFIVAWGVLACSLLREKA